MNSLQPSAFNLAPPPTLQWQPVQIANFMAVAGRAYPCDTTSAAFTVTLPASPAAGNLITLTDYAGTWGTNNLTVNPNGLKINGATANVTLSTNRGSVQIVYVDSTQGWIAYSGFAVTSFGVPLEYLVVGGGGSGGRGGSAGGGGAGGFRKGSYTASLAQVFTVTVGDGGAGLAGAGAGNDGTNSSLSATGGFSTITSSGGGGASGGSVAAKQGGSGGGGSGTASYTSGALGNKGGYTPSEGSTGGNGDSSIGSGGGGGGAGAVGGNSSGSTGGNGGSGSEWPTGSGTYYAGGGAGYGSVTNGTGGTGGGGNVDTAGGVNTGGGGGAWGGVGATSGAGGKGVVIIRYPDSYAAATSTTGSPTITVSGGYRTYKFTGNGTLTL